MATWGVSSRDRECGRGAVPSPYIQGRYEGPSFIDAVHLERDSKLNHAQRLRCAVRIFSLKRGEEEVDLDKLEFPLMQHHPSDWYTESVDDVFFSAMETSSLGGFRPAARSCCFKPAARNY